MNRAEASLDRVDTIQRITWWALVGSILLCLALQAWLALVTEINWDEFFFLSHVYAYQGGELTKVLQTFHVQLLGWLTSIPGDEIAQVEAGRLVMLLCEAATCALIYALARRFFEPGPSLLASLAYVSAGFTVMHGASFRADPLAAALMMASLTALARGRMTALTLLVTALSAAFAALVTVKVVLYAPAFAGIATWRWSMAEDRRHALKWLAAAAGAAALLFACLYALHQASLPRASTAAGQAMMSSTARTMVIDAGLLPRAHEIVRAALLSPLQTLLLIVGLIGAIFCVARKRGEQRLSALVVLACAAPMLSLFFYRNAFPYFFAFILPPAALLIAWAIEHTALFKRHLLLLAVGCAVPAVAVAGNWSARDQVPQQELISAVHRIFPRPVPYIDRNGIVASFPKRGFFMSTWGMQDYLRRGTPVFDQILAMETVPLLIIDGPALEHAIGRREGLPASLTLLDRDRQTLRANYIPHWGAIWVAGQTHRVGSAGTDITILVPGTYTVERASVAIDGQTVLEGSTVGLSRGRHRLSSPAPETVILRWGDHLWRPAQAAHPGRIYRGF